MIVIHFAKVGALYPRVVISSLHGRLKKPPFCHSYTSIGACPRDHYMLLQRFSMGCMPSLAKIVCGTIAMLRFLRVVHSTTTPLALCGLERMTMPWWMEDQHSQHSTQAKLNTIKMERLVWWLKTTGLTSTTNHKNPILKYEGLGNQLMNAASGH
jgi:hypothetical protein